MTIDTIGCGGIARCDSLPVHTRLVLGVLIDPLLRSEFVNQIGIAMTPGTELWHFRPFDRPEKPAFWTHRGFRIIQTRVSAVTVDTTKTLVLVHVCTKGLSWSLQAAVERRVTLDAGVLGRNAKRREKPQQEDADPVVSEMSHR